MKKIQETKPIWHAVIWIIIYVGIINVAGIIGESTKIGDIATSILLIVLSLILLVYLKVNKSFEFYGFKKLKKEDLKRTLFYIPLVLFAFIQYIKGINYELGVTQIVNGCILMICVGFIEELIFRGFLYQGILKKSGVKRAIIISGITFGFGHIVNLLSGYSTQDQIIQILGAVVIGIVLAYCVAITKSIIPGIIFHILFNISGTITNINMNLEIYVLVAIIAIGAIYSIYLKKLVDYNKITKEVV